MEDQYESNKKKLFSCAMKGEWDKVIALYKDDVRLHNARITRSGQTALHIAVSDGKKHVVKQMVHVMSQTQPNNEELTKALRTHNHRKNTALHLAASMGNASICSTIASVEATLVDDRNDDGETPLFLAALHGRKQAFLCLHNIRNSNITSTTTPPLYVNCRRNNADTILHCAINGDYFDLAFQIIHLYKELANWVNGEALSPLHLLASKPCAFKSGSRLGLLETIIYHCIHVEKLKAESPAHEHLTSPSAAKDSDSHAYPPNYNKLWDVFRLIGKVVTVGLWNPDGQNKELSKPVEMDAEDPEARAGGSRVDRDQENPLFPANYKTCCHLIKFFYLLLLIILGKGYEELREVYRKKETHTWSVQIVKLLLHYASSYEYEDDGINPQEDEGYNMTSLPTSVKPGSTKVKENEQLTKISAKGTPILVAAKNAVNMETAEKIMELLAVEEGAKAKQLPARGRTESPILVAAKNGVLEIIESIVELFPVAIHDLNEDKKNVLLLAAEHRQPHVYEFLLKKNIYKESLFDQVDKNGNSALHWAATLGDYNPWLISGEALQMQWELSWYEYVKRSMPAGFVPLHNYKNETPHEVFTRTHSELVKSGGKWIIKTSESCSVVAALVATVAFATSTTVPGGVNQESGYPTLENETAFDVFAASSLSALCCSVMAVVTFLSLLTCRFQEQDFHKDKPMRMKLLIGLTLLLMSITSMLVSFCAGHFFVLKHRLHRAAFTLYAVTCLSVIFYVLSQFPLYFNYLRATFIRVPQRR